MIIKHGGHILREMFEVRKGLWAFFPDCAFRVLIGSDHVDKYLIFTSMFSGRISLKASNFLTRPTFMKLEKMGIIKDLADFPDPGLYGDASSLPL